MYFSAVTPLAGVWIEIIANIVLIKKCGVTPLAGVWIEILLSICIMRTASPSLPLRECGLKFHNDYIWENCFCVTPLAGVWIEIDALHRQ